MNLARNNGDFLRKLQNIVVIVTVTLHFIIPSIAEPHIVISILTHNNWAKSRYLIKIQSALYFNLQIKKKTKKKRNGDDAKILII